MQEAVITTISPETEEIKKLASRIDSDNPLTSEEVNLLVGKLKQDLPQIAFIWFNFLKKISNRIDIKQANRELIENIYKAQDAEPGSISKSVLPKSVEIDMYVLEFKLYLMGQLNPFTSLAEVNGLSEIVCGNTKKERLTAFLDAEKNYMGEYKNLIKALKVGMKQSISPYNKDVEFIDKQVTELVKSVDVQDIYPEEILRYLGLAQDIKVLRRQVEKARPEWFVGKN